MQPWYQGTVAQLVIWATLLAIVTAVATYILGKLRATTSQQEPNAHEMLSKFREMHARGELSDAEFRTIKTRLAARFQEPIKDAAETGYNDGDKPL